MENLSLVSMTVRIEHKDKTCATYEVVRAQLYYEIQHDKHTCAIICTDGMRYTIPANELPEIHKDCLEIAKSILVFLPIRKLASSHFLALQFTTDRSANLSKQFFCKNNTLEFKDFNLPS